MDPEEWARHWNLHKVSGHVDPEENLPRRLYSAHLERYTFVETLPNDDNRKAI